MINTLQKIDIQYCKAIKERYEYIKLKTDLQIDPCNMHLKPRLYGALLEHPLKNLASMKVAVAMMWWLCSLSNKDDTSFKYAIVITYDELVSMCGASNRQIENALKELEKSNILLVEHRRPSTNGNRMLKNCYLFNPYYDTWLHIIAEKNERRQEAHKKESEKLCQVKKNKTDKSKQKEWSHNYYVKHKDSIKKEHLEYYNKNKDKIKEANRKRALDYYYSHKDEIKEKKRLKKAANNGRLSDVERRKALKYYYANRERILKNMRDRYHAKRGKQDGKDKSHEPRMTRGDEVGEK